MAFEGLSEKLSAAFKRLRSKGKLTESDVKAAMREVRLALLEADVNYKVAKDFTNKVTERAIGQDVMESLTPAQMVIKIVDEELCELMGGTETRLATSSRLPTIIMMCGLQGSGKTTHSGKLALMLKNQGHITRTGCDGRTSINVVMLGSASPKDILILFYLEIVFVTTQCTEEELVRAVGPVDGRRVGPLARVKSGSGGQCVFIGGRSLLPEQAE